MSMKNHRCSERCEEPGGCVYVMHNTRNGFFKIGYSKNPQYRESTLQSEEPVVGTPLPEPEVELLFSYPSPKCFERELHEVYAEQRVRGEWFQLTPENLENITFNLECMSQ